MVQIFCDGWEEINDSPRILDHGSCYCSLSQAELGKKNNIAKKVDKIELFYCWNRSTCLGPPARKEKRAYKRFYLALKLLRRTMHF